MKNAMAEIKKLEPQVAAQKVADLRKAMFENKQKLMRGEFKDTNFFKTSRKEIARLLSVAGKNAVIAEPKATVARETKVIAKPKKEKVAKVAKVKAVKVAKAAKAEVAVQAEPAAAPKKTRKTKAKKEEQ
jgi:ribosomal protein L29